MEKDLCKANKIGESLHLYCQKHPKTQVEVKTVEDFGLVPEGGCTEPCTYRLDCGHTCRLSCHPYDPQHKEVKCYKRCDKELCKEFGHRCEKKCCEKCPLQCPVMVDRKIERCGHTIKAKCSEKIETLQCYHPCECVRQCMHKCTVKCGSLHSPEQCNEKRKKTWSCGHVSEERCRGTLKAIDPCPKKCSQLLECGHACKGSCGKCWNGRYHIPCKEKCERTLVCGHFCKEPCTSECPPCSEKCNNSCPHSDCRNKCGEKCTKCRERCHWRCPHYQCTKLCYELCNRPRCNEPCKKRLPCKHLCVGLCGEKCPRLCRECHHDKLTELFFGTEDEDDARFIELTDCKHIFEVTAIDNWMDQGKTDGDPEILLKICPRCNAPIRKHLRYRNNVKQLRNDIEAVKARSWGDKEENEKKRNGLMKEIAECASIPNELIRKLLQNIGITKKVNERDQMEFNIEYGIFQPKIEEYNYEFAPAPSKMHLDIATNQFRFIKEIFKIKKVVDESYGIELVVFNYVVVHTPRKILEENIHDLSNRIVQYKNNVSGQELNDIQLEIARIKMFAKAGIMIAKRKRRAIQVEDELSKKLKMLSSFVSDGQPFTKSKEETCKNIIEELAKALNMPIAGLGISEDERVMIVKAMGLGGGHWYKCPKGHIYAITECGGATEESNCPECYAKIGGTGHRLTAGNLHAGEMDKSTAPAWPQPQLNNPLNYEELLADL